MRASGVVSLMALGVFGCDVLADRGLVADKDDGHNASARAAVRRPRRERG
jgi:hypothetical protein